MNWNNNSNVNAQEKDQVRRKAILGAAVGGPLGGIMAAASERRRIAKSNAGKRK